MRLSCRPLALLLSTGAPSLARSSSAAARPLAPAFSTSAATAFVPRALLDRPKSGALPASSVLRSRRRRRPLLLAAAATPPRSAAGRLSMSSSSSSSSAVEKVPNRISLCQFEVTPSKETNHGTARRYLSRAASEGASLAVLPEIWNGPYATAAFGEYAEPLPSVGATLDDDEIESPSARLLMESAKAHGMYVVGGSVPERDGDEIYNTCLIVDPDGRIVGKHRKVHLFDIDVKGGITFKESDTLTGGGSMTTFDAGEAFGTVGVGICYDIRFPEYALLLTQKHPSVNLLVYPGAFNLTTGPAHWELLQRARAVDCQCFVATASPARVEPPEEEGRYPHYSAWGHSTVVSPWGEVIATCDEKEALVIADLDSNEVSKMRNGIPVRKQKRNDLYRIVDGDDGNRS